MQIQLSKDDILKYVVFVILKRKVLLFAAWFTTLFAVIFFTYLITPTWEGLCQIVVERNSKQQLGVFKDVNLPSGETESGGASALNLLPILTGKNMAYDIVNEFSLDKEEREKRFNPENLRERAKNFIVDVVMSPLYLLQKLGILGDAEKNWADEAAEDLIEDWEDIEVEEGTSIINVNIWGESPRLAMDVANRMVELLQERAQAYSRGGAQKSYGYVEKELAASEKNFRQAEGILVAFKKENNIILMDETKKMEVAKLGQYQSDLLSTLKDQKEADARLAENMAEMGRQRQRGVLSNLLAKNPVAAQLESSLRALEIKMASLLTEKSEGHPEVQRLKAEIEETKNALKDTVLGITRDQTESFNPLYQDLLNREIDLRSQKVMLKARESNLKKVIKDVTEEIKDLVEKEVQLARLQEGVDLHRSVYQALKTKVAELSVERESSNSEYTIRVLDKAYVSNDQDPNWPIWPLNIIGGIVLASIFGLGSIFFVEYWKDTVVYPRDVEEGLSLPFIGGVPDLKSPFNHSNGRGKRVAERISSSLGEKI